MELIVQIIELVVVLHVEHENTVLIDLVLVVLHEIDIMRIHHVVRLLVQIQNLPIHIIQTMQVVTVVRGVVKTDISIIRPLSYVYQHVPEQNQVETE